jgi:hypothetical protein
VFTFVIWADDLIRKDVQLGHENNPCYSGYRYLLRTMRKRSFSITLLVVAFLFSSWSNVIAAAFCPRYSSSRNCHIQQRQIKQVEHKSSCQHEMADMEMGDIQMDDTNMGSEAASETSDNSIPESPPVQIATDSYSEGLAVDFHTEPCGHCWMHSQPSSGTATIVAVDPSRQLAETNAPPANFVVALPSAFVVPIVPLEHGPPGNSFPRHLLISVFRI